MTDTINKKFRQTRGAGNLRFIERDGKKILQQAGEFVDYENGLMVNIGVDWQDVPCVIEE